MKRQKYKSGGEIRFTIMPALTASSLFTSSSLRASKTTTSTSKKNSSSSSSERKTNVVCRSQKQQKTSESRNSISLAPSSSKNECIQQIATKTKSSPPLPHTATGPTPTQIAAGVFAAAAIGVTARKAMKKKSKKVVIAGAPASGKGTQCELIVKKFGITHISAGDLLRAAVAQGTEDGLKAKEFMDRGDLVPDEVVVNMVKSRLNEPDCAGGWLLDGYPRSASQAEALSSYGIEPDLFLLLDVPDEELLERVVGRRLDPVTGQIYHLKFFPPPDETVAKRLTQRSDDTDEKAQNRLKVHHANVNAVLSKYKNIMKTIDGNRQKTTVFKEIEGLINSM